MGSCKCIRVNVANINLNGWLRQQKKNRSIRIETLDKTTLKSIFESGSGRFVEKHGEKLVGELHFS